MYKLRPINPLKVKTKSNMERIRKAKEMADSTIKKLRGTCDQYPENLEQKGLEKEYNQLLIFCSPFSTNTDPRKVRQSRYQRRARRKFQERIVE